MAYPLHLGISFRKILFSHRPVVSFPRPNIYFPSPIFSTHWHWSQSTAFIILSSQSKQTEGTPISRHMNLCRQVLFGEGSLIPMTAVFSNSAHKTGMLLPGKPLRPPSDIHGLPWWLRWLRICSQCGRPGFNSWVRKIPWRRKCLPTPVFLPGEFQWIQKPGRLQSRGSQRVDKTEQLSLFWHSRILAEA